MKSLCTYLYMLFFPVHAQPLHNRRGTDVLQKRSLSMILTRVSPKAVSITTEHHEFFRELQRHSLERTTKHLR